MFDLKERSESEFSGVPVPLPGRVMLFAGPGGASMVRLPSGVVRAAGGAGAGGAGAGAGATAWRGVAQVVQVDRAGDIQLFGGVDLSAFMAGAADFFVDIEAPLFVRIDAARALVECDIDLFVRVNGGAWTWWDSNDIVWGDVGQWRSAGLSAQFAVHGGKLWARSSNPKPMDLGGTGALIEWACKLQFAVDDATAINARIGVV